MKKRVSSSLTLYFESLFPKTFQRGVRHNLAVIGMGGNVGDVRRRFKKVVVNLQKNPSIRIVKSGPILKNPPFGFKEQPDFYNTVILVDTKLSPKELLKRLLYIEKRYKRVRTFKNAPRTLDLDIIFYNDLKLRSSELNIPHPFWNERESVIIPLKFLGEIG